MEEEKIDKAIRASGIELGDALGMMSESDLDDSKLSGGLCWTVSTSEL